jgi:hypothetical protein
MRLRMSLLAIGLMVMPISAVTMPSAWAQEAAKPETAWQAAITSQIEAFRGADGATALKFAGAGFRDQFSDPQQFLMAITQMGYEPLVHSRSHSFGKFEQFDATHAMQIVNIVGPDQLLYEALYQMMMESDGWRVEAVSMKRADGLAV